jgi:hypothetical protein
MSLALYNPIVDSPFGEPTRYWDYKEGQPDTLPNAEDSSACVPSQWCGLWTE